MNEDLLSLFKAKRDEIGATQLADSLGVKSSAVRMICTGNYPNPVHVLNKFASVYINVVFCPFAERNIERAECRLRAAEPKPCCGGRRRAWWQACQTCPHKGE